jgi:hypothetical protein
MRSARGDMRDHIVSPKNDHGASYERYGVLQWWSWLKIGFCEIFGVVQFSTFATVSAKSCRSRNVRIGCARCKGGAFQWVQIPSGNRSNRKQSEQSWR